MNRSLINLKEIPPEDWERIGERFMDLSSEYRYRAAASATDWHSFTGKLPPKSQVMINVCKDDFSVFLAEGVLGFLSLQFYGEKFVYKEGTFPHSYDAFLKFPSSRVPTNAEIVYKRLLKKAGKLVPGEAYDEIWRGSVREHSVERNRNAILRFYRDFITVAKLTPERGEIHDMIGYDE